MRNSVGNIKDLIEKEKVILYNVRKSTGKDRCENVHCG